MNITSNRLTRDLNILHMNSATAVSVIGTLLKNNQFDCSSYHFINCLSNFPP